MMKQTEHPLKPYSWIGQLAAAALLALLVSVARTPSEHIDKLEERVKLLELSKAADDVDRKNMLTTLNDVKAQSTQLLTTIGELKLDIRDLKKAK